MAEQRAGDNLSGDCTKNSRPAPQPPPGTALPASAAGLDVLLRNTAIISSEKMEQQKSGTCLSFFSQVMHGSEAICNVKVLFF